MGERLATPYVYDEHYPFLREKSDLLNNFSERRRVALLTLLTAYLPFGLRPGHTILDVGSGLGDVGHYLQYGGIETFGVDINYAAIRKGREIFGFEKRNQSVQAESLHLPFRGASFDTIVSQDFFEHLENEVVAKDVFAEMNRVCIGGKMLHKITVLEDEQNIHADESHIIKESANWWKDFFEKQGWKVTRPTTYHFPPWTKKRLQFYKMHGFFLLKKNAV